MAGSSLRDRLVRALLRLFPGEFRGDFGDQILPKSLAFTRLTAPLLSVTLARLFWDHGVVRRHEREADEFAVRCDLPRRIVEGRP
jgi:hypothetical protein